LQALYLTILNVVKLWLGLLALATLTACNQVSQTSNHQETFYVFGTSVIVQIQGVSKQTAHNAIQAIEKDFHHLNREWHAWDKGGIVSQINQAIADKKPITVSKKVKQFILFSKTLAEQSNYLFDPAIGKLIQLWSFHSEDWQGPPPAELKMQQWLNNRPSIQDVFFEGNVLYSKNNQVQLDFGANAKGLALKRAVQYLKEYEIKNAIVNIGGDMTVIGQKTNSDGSSQSWNIGIQSPSNPKNVIAVASIDSGLSIVTSGTYQRYFEWQGKRYSHLLDPKTGKPADTLASVTVIHADPTRADAAATAILIAGKKHWQTVAKQMKITNVFLIDQQGKITNTSPHISLKH